MNKEFVKLCINSNEHYIKLKEIEKVEVNHYHACGEKDTYIIYKDNKYKVDKISEINVMRYVEGRTCFELNVIDEK